MVRLSIQQPSLVLLIQLSLAQSKASREKEIEEAGQKENIKGD